MGKKTHCRLGYVHQLASGCLFRSLDKMSSENTARIVNKAYGSADFLILSTRIPSSFLGIFSITESAIVPITIKIIVSPLTGFGTMSVRKMMTGKNIRIKIWR